jgi:hypothetical protein
VAGRRAKSRVSKSTMRIRKNICECGPKQVCSLCKERVKTGEAQWSRYAGHRPAIPYANKVDSKEERRDSCSATEEEEGWRACYGWPRNWRCLGELSAMELAHQNMKDPAVARELRSILLPQLTKPTYRGLSPTFFRGNKTLWISSGRCRRRRNGLHGTR